MCVPPLWVGNIILLSLSQLTFRERYKSHAHTPAPTVGHSQKQRIKFIVHDIFSSNSINCGHRKDPFTNTPAGTNHKLHMHLLERTTVAFNINPEAAGLTLEKRIGGYFLDWRRKRKRKKRNYSNSVSLQLSDSRCNHNMNAKSSQSAVLLLFFTSNTEVKWHISIFIIPTAARLVRANSQQ